MIFTREGPITDETEMAQYRNAIRQHTALYSEQYQLKPLAVYGSLEVMEGDAADGVVILEFPSMEAARDWYGSSEYQSAIAHRKLAAEYRVVLVEGL